MLKRVINSESDLMNVARNVNNIVSGVSVDVQTPQAQPQEDTSFAKTSGFNYLQTRRFTTTSTGSLEFSITTGLETPQAGLLEEDKGE